MGDGQSSTIINEVCKLRAYAESARQTAAALAHRDCRKTPSDSLGHGGLPRAPLQQLAAELDGARHQLPVQAVLELLEAPVVPLLHAHTQCKARRGKRGCASDKSEHNATVLLHPW